MTWTVHSHRAVATTALRETAERRLVMSPLRRCLWGNHPSTGSFWSAKRASRSIKFKQFGEVATESRPCVTQGEGRPPGHRMPSGIPGRRCAVARPNRQIHPRCPSEPSGNSRVHTRGESCGYTEQTAKEDACSSSD
jgi:hypothetical protein